MTYQFSDEIKHHFSDVVDRVAEIGGWVVDLSDNSIQWSQQTYLIHGLEGREHIQLTEAIDFFLPAWREMVRGLYYAASCKGKPFSFEAQITAIDEQVKWVKVHGKPVLDDSGTPTKVVGIFEDVSDRVNNFNQIQNQKQFLGSIVDNILQGLIVINDKGLIKSCNSSACRIFEYKESEVLGKNLSILMSEPDASRHDGFMQNYQMTQQKKIIGIGREVMALKSDGTVFPLYLAVSEVLLNDEPHFLGTVRDLSEEKQSAEKIEWLSNYDDFTGLSNRNYLFSYLDGYEFRQKIAVVSINIDRFKRIYLAYGFDDSNLVIKTVAERLQDFCGNSGFACRDMADRFWLVLFEENLNDCEDLNKQLAQLKGFLEQPIGIAQHNHYITVSMGAAVLDDNASPVTLLSKAELALHDAKRNGHGKFKVFDKGHHKEAILHAYNIERQLREAITRDELLFVAQPKYCNQGQLTSAELLVRWQKQDGAMVFPDTFIDIAEESGLILQIGKKALQAAAELMAELKTAAPALTLAVNISPLQFIKDDFIDNLTEIFAQHQVSLSNLILEITENLMVSDFELLKAKTQELASLGVKISIDDFGTGYSNLQRIQQLAISEIKIDKSFTWQCLESQGKDLLNAMVNVGKSMKLDVVAEGVESFEHIEILRDMGVDTFQGYYYSKPLPLVEFTSLVDSE